MTGFLDYYKTILDKVSFDSILFNKEYHKAKRSLRSHEVGDLDNWLKTKGLHYGLSNHKHGNDNVGDFH